MYTRERLSIVSVALLRRAGQLLAGERVATIALVSISLDMKNLCALSKRK